MGINDTDQKRNKPKGNLINPNFKKRKHMGAKLGDNITQ